MASTTSAASNLPSSPAARAFFAALDESQQTSQNSSGGSSSSLFIQKRIQTLGWRNRHSLSERYPAKVACCEFSVLQVQRGEVEGTYGTGATVWPASIVLLKYLERHSAALVAGKMFVDLGAGTGITSIGAAVLGAKRVVCTDGEPKVVQLARDNVKQATKQLGGTIPSTSKEDDSSEESSKECCTIRGCPVTVQDYWWGTGSIQGGRQECDVVLVSDCVLPKLYPIAPLVDALDQLLVKPTSVAILSYEHRYYPDYDPRDKFRELCDAKDLQVELVPEKDQDPIYSVDDIEVWKVTRKAITAKLSGVE